MEVIAGHIASEGYTAVCGSAIDRTIRGIFRQAKNLVDHTCRSLSDAAEMNQYRSSEVIREMQCRLNESIDILAQRYSSVLDKTLDQVEPFIKGVIEHLLESIRVEMETAERAASEASASLQAAANSFPFSNRQPQVGGYSPQTLFGDENRPIYFRGNFFYGEGATLSLQGRRLRPIVRTTNTLQFSIPTQLFRDVQQLTRLPATLRIPIPTSSYCPTRILFGPSYATFPITLVALPRIMGRIIIDNGSGKGVEEIDLPWGANLTRSVKKRSWKVTLKAYNGSHYLFSSAYLENLFLKVQDLSDRIHIKVKSPTERWQEDRQKIYHEPEALRITQPVSPPGTPPAEPISPFRASLGPLPSTIDIVDFRPYKTCPPELKQFEYLYTKHIKDKQVKKIQWAQNHKVVALKKSGKWRFYWVGPPSSAFHESTGDFQQAFVVFQSRYLDMARKLLPSRL